MILESVNDYRAACLNDDVGYVIILCRADGRVGVIGLRYGYLGLGWRLDDATTNPHGCHGPMAGRRAVVVGCGFWKLLDRRRRKANLHADFNDGPL